MAQNICQNCNAVLDDDCSFCPNCGTPVNSAPAVQQTAYTYTPPAYAQPQYSYNPQQYVVPIGNGPGKAGMVLGIISAAFLLLSWFFLPLIIVSSVLSVIGLPLSIAGMCMSNRPKGKATAGLVLNILPFVVLIFKFAVLGFVFDMLSSLGW